MTPSPRIRRRAIVAGGQWPDSVPPLLRRIYEARGALSIDQAQPRLAQLLAPQRPHVARRRIVRQHPVHDLECADTVHQPLVHFEIQPQLPVGDTVDQR